ncbi:hypothetical protein J0A67_01470 [Algoriphagus aestuariicola]|uniref:Guanylate cyclase domain-containing protein n=1 Tax=Algoriphagus aestuariicola TaxID=1852016 RepID=A0ABS3BMP3_9BACT|nr:hypothetical protein [Algoriphagus aestuariicola]MBN7799506.1 hypothetical protein [Algoriphagus aestuariicola]
MEIKEKFEGFKSAERPTIGLALVFDISGFTNFFNKPDIHYYVTDYINQIINCVETNIFGGLDFWSNEEEDEIDALDAKPILRKFLGDGMLYVWEDNDEGILSVPDIKIDLINRLWNIQLKFDKINKRLNETIPIGDLPNSIKFGIAQGTIFKLTEVNGTIDCIGPCINLASRLVKYSHEINFIASARLNLPKQKLEENGYFRIIAKELRSFENEIVIIDKNDYENVNLADKKRLFREL